MFCIYSRIKQDHFGVFFSEMEIQFNEDLMVGFFNTEITSGRFRHTMPVS